MIQISNKSYGLGKERELRKIFEKRNMVVLPCKGSLGRFDGISFSKTEVILFQSKATKQRYYSYKQEIEEIRKFDNYPKGWKKRLYIYLSPHKERKESGWSYIDIL